MPKILDSKLVKKGMLIGKNGRIVSSVCMLAATHKSQAYASGSSMGIFFGISLELIFPFSPGTI